MTAGVDRRRPGKVRDPVSQPDNTGQEAPGSRQHFEISAADVEPRLRDFGPPLAQRPKRVIFLVEAKLIGIDMLLPVAMQIREEAPDMPILFVLTQEEYRDDIESNYVLWEGMTEVGEVRHLLPRRRWNIPFLHRMASLYRLARLMRYCLSGPCVLFSRRDPGSWPIVALALAVRRAGGALIGCPSVGYPLSRPLLESLVGQEPTPVHRRLQADRHWLFHPLQGVEQRSVTSAPFQVAGTSKHYPAWLGYLRRALGAGKVRDEHGRVIATGDQRPLVIFYPGSHDLPDLRTPTSCRDSLLLTLRAVRRAWPELPVLIKPHVICDRQELQRDMESFPELDLRVTLAHPQLLAMLSCACVTTNGTSVSDDIYTCGSVLLDTSDYEETIACGAGSLFPNRARIDCSNEDRLAGILSEMKHGTFIKPEAEVEHLVHPKPDSITGLLWRRG